LIGDHFLSHTIVTMLLAWIIVLLINSWVSYIESRFFNKLIITDKLPIKTKSDYNGPIILYVDSINNYENI